jgi:hypothetical protein
MRLDFKEERDEDFLSSYLSVIKDHGKSAPFLKKEYILAQAIRRPARRFYVSEEQCLRIIGDMLKGKKEEIKNPLKAEMYGEICRRVRQIIGNTKQPLPDIIQEVISQPAPRFYLTLESAQILYYKLIRQRQCARRNR